MSGDGCMPNVRPLSLPMPFFSCLLVDLSQDLLVLEKVVFLSISSLT